MAGLRLLLSVFFLYVAVFVGFFLYVTRLEETPLPDEYWKDHYWGSKVWKLGALVLKDDETIRPFKIAVEEKVIQDLKHRLTNSRIQQSIPGVNFEYGFPSTELHKVVDYWLNKYDWLKEEQKLNRYNHYKTQVEGLDIHFIHVKPKTTTTRKAVPLLLVHGWPGSFAEFMKIIPHLTESTGANFELVIPSIPGYGFSEAAHRPGLHVFHISRIMVKLMKRLGHEKFLFQGGNWGGAVGVALAATYPHNLIGLHTNFAMVKVGARDWLRLIAADLGFAGIVFEDPASEIQRMNPVSKVIVYVLKEFGYLHVQATKPDTVGAALNDSPAGMAAYILEKFSTWTNPANVDKPDGGLLEKFTMDELLTNVMIYWINGNMASSQRLYKEAFGTLNEYHVPRVPWGALVGRHEQPLSMPISLLRRHIPNLVQYKDADVGGHFLAMEEPKLLANAIREFFSKIAHLK